MIGSFRALAGRADALRYRWFARKGPRIERVSGLELWIPETVLGVADFRAGALLAGAVVSCGAARVLDMGSGSGVVGIAAARAGAQVVAIDLNEVAVRATRVNAMLNRVEVEARLGDLFGPLAPEERFELIAFNPPFFERPLDHPLALALSGGLGLPLLDRFLREARGWLVPDGRVLIAGSTNGALGRMRALFEAHRFTWRTVRARERMAERLVIDELE